MCGTRIVQFSVCLYFRGIDCWAAWSLDTLPPLHGGSLPHLITKYAMPSVVGLSGSAHQWRRSKRNAVIGAVSGLRRQYAKWKNATTQRPPSGLCIVVCGPMNWRDSVHKRSTAVGEPRNVWRVGSGKSLGGAFNPRCLSRLLSLLRCGYRHVTSRVLYVYRIFRWLGCIAPCIG